VLSQEYPSLTCVHHDTVPGLGAARLLDAFDLHDDARTVALRGAHRWAPVFTADPPAVAGSAVVPGGVYLITGGLGRIGLVIARALADRERVRLVLVGRSGVPTDEESARAVRELEDSGSEVLLSVTDVADVE